MTLKVSIAQGKLCKGEKAMFRRGPYWRVSVNAARSSDHVALAIVLHIDPAPVRLKIKGDSYLVYVTHGIFRVAVTAEKHGKIISTGGESTNKDLAIKIVESKGRNTESASDPKLEFGVASFNKQSVSVGMSGPRHSSTNEDHCQVMYEKVCKPLSVLNGPNGKVVWTWERFRVPFGETIPPDIAHLGVKYECNRTLERLHVKAKPSSPKYYFGGESFDTPVDIGLRIRVNSRFPFSTKRRRRRVASEIEIKTADSKIVHVYIDIPKS